MARVTHATSHLSLAEVKQRIKTEPRADRRQRWLIRVYQDLWYTPFSKQKRLNDNATICKRER